MLRLESDSLLSEFERVRPRLAEAYSEGMGRPAIDPFRMLKILFLQDRTRNDTGYRCQFQTKHCGGCP